MSIGKLPDNDLFILLFSGPVPERDILFSRGLLRLRAKKFRESTPSPHDLAWFLTRQGACQRCTPTPHTTWHDY